MQEDLAAQVSTLASQLADAQREHAAKVAAFDLLRAEHASAVADVARLHTLVDEGAAARTAAETAHTAARTHLQQQLDEVTEALTSARRELQLVAAARDAALAVADAAEDHLQLQRAAADAAASSARAADAAALEQQQAALAAAADARDSAGEWQRPEARKHVVM